MEQIRLISIGENSPWKLTRLVFCLPQLSFEQCGLLPLKLFYIPLAARLNVNDALIVHFCLLKE